MRRVSDAFGRRTLPPEEHEQQQHSHGQRHDEHHGCHISRAAFVGAYLRHDPFHGVLYPWVGVTEWTCTVADVPTRMPGASPEMSTTVASAERTTVTLPCRTPAAASSATASLRAASGFGP